jgi:hypothetical protein
MPQRTAADTGAREDLKAAEMSVNHYTHIYIADRPETDYIYRAKDYSIESTPSITATELAPELVCRRFNCNTLSYLS